MQKTGAHRVRPPHPRDRRPQGEARPVPPVPRSPAAFIETLSRQRGVGADREFESFLALPEPDPTEVFIGMTTYDSLRANARIQRNPKVVWDFLRFARTMDLKAYVYVRPVEGPPFDLARLAARPGEVLEVGVRRVTDPAGFDATRPPFIELLSGQPGVGDSWELEVVKGKDTAGLTVGMTVYQDRQAADAAIGALREHPTTAAYFATFEPVALQYATSTTNH
ncbi:MAG: hypothetical protein KDB35_23315 [Acidimicrobiales bacterium]|nr:hypothetical protein [Acidimicrobiales bacterium]